MFTWTPLTFGILLVPVLVMKWPELDMMAKTSLGAVYFLTSLLFPLLAYRAVANNALQVWVTPKRDRLIVERRTFWFRLQTEEFLIRHLRPLYFRGMDRHCWFECRKTKRKILLVSEQMDHPIWFELLGIKQKDISSVKHQMLFTEARGSPKNF